MSNKSGVTAQVARSQNPEVKMRMPSTRSENSVVWQKARQSVLAAYRWWRTFHRSETYGLSLEEASKRLDAYSQAILNSDF
jgi:hypothetical protein